jgi:exodeoxyribonuclease VII large subunit
MSAAGAEQVVRAGRRSLPPTAAATTAEQPWPVRLLTAKIADYVAKMSTVWVEGQVVQCTLRPGTTLAFLTLRDTDVDMSLSVTAHARVLAGFPDGLREGARVVVRARPEFRTKRGTLQLEAQEIRAVGIGELLARVEHLKRVLADEGLLDAGRKRPLPFLPRAVGLVCGRGSAAERDVVVTATGRWPGVRFVLRQVPVQGSAAAGEVTAAVRVLDADPEVDVIVVARGGGSLEDLLPFSDEGLVRAVAACRTPVVSAIGHEVDSPLLDLVADVRASTPTDAGRRVVPAVAEELAGLAGARRRLVQAVLRRVDAEASGLAALRARPALAQPGRMVEARQQQVDQVLARSRRGLDATLARAQGRLDALVAGVRALSPAATLVRGYAVVQRVDPAGGTATPVVRSPDDVADGDEVRILLASGRIGAQVTSRGSSEPQVQGQGEGSSGG